MISGPRSSILCPMNQLQNNNNKQQKSRNTPVFQAGVFPLYQNEVMDMGFFSWLGFGKLRDTRDGVKAMTGESFGQKKRARRIRLFSGVVRRRPPQFIAILYRTEPKYARASGIAQKML